MAFSMFLRSPACTRSLGQQLMRLSTQPGFSQRTVASTLPIKSLALKDVNTTPFLKAVKNFSTSPIRMSMGKDHSKLWVMERLTSVVLVPLVPLALLMPNKMFDALLAILVTAHTFWGLEAIAVDYVRASIVGPLLPKVAVGLVYALCIATLGGLFYHIGHDVGIANTIRNFWAIKHEQRA